MASKKSDIDLSLEGYDPDDLFPTNSSRRRRPDSGFGIEEPRRAQAASRPTERPADDDPDDEPRPKARKRPKPKADEPDEPAYDDKPRRSILGFFTDMRLRYFLGVSLFILSFFVLFAFISHYKNAALDQSIVTNTPVSELAQHKDEISNSTGVLGAWLARTLLCDALGVGSLVFIVYAWLLGLGLLGVRRCNFWSVTFKTLLVAITASIVVGLVTFDTESVIRWGGRHGYYVNRWLVDHFTMLGAIVVSSILVFAIICVYLDELRIVWNRWQATKRRHRLQEELRRERQRKLDNVPDGEPAPSQPVRQAATVDIDNQDIDQGRNHPAAADPQLRPVTRPVSYGVSIDEIIADDTPEPQPEFKAEPQAGFGIDTEPLPPTPSPGPQPAGPDAPQTIFSIDDEGGSFSVTAPTIEMADHVGVATPYDHRAELPRYKFPSIDLLEERDSGPVIDLDEQQANKDRIVKTLLDYRIPISKIDATVGPTVTLYEIVPAEGVRISQIKRLEDDIALSLAAMGIRIIAPIPGKGTVGIEVPNRDPRTVSMRSVIASKKYQECKMALPMAMGATIANEIFVADLAKMPHLLVAGATGQGKSVGLNAIITSLLYKKHPSELKFVLIDPKMVEFSLYSKLERHYLAKLPDEEDAIITDPSKVIQTLNSLCIEMDNRYALLRDANVRSLEEYNKKFTDRRLNPEKGHRYMPYIVVIVDEFADLIMTAGKEVETPIARIAQKARAVGMHMIIATQRPSTNVITGIIKANFPGRIAFRVSQMVDSKTILDRTGANQLIGKGDMLFYHNGNMERVQCAFVSTEEVEAITESIDEQVGFEHAYYLPEYVPEGAVDGGMAGASMERDTMFDEAARFVVQRQMGSTSSLQRQFGIGYNRAGKLMDQMEAAGIVGPVNGSKPRAILVDIMTLEQILGN